MNSRNQSSPSPLTCNVCCEHLDKTDTGFTPNKAARKCPNCRRTYAKQAQSSPQLRKSATSVTNQKNKPPRTSKTVTKTARNRRKSSEKAVAKPLDLKISISTTKKKKTGTPKKGYAFYMFQYKCKPCTRQRCQAKVFCAGFHHQGERRRNPQVYKYSYEPCPAVKETHKWRDASRCKKGDACDKAHTLLEQMYHPYIYKTSLCANFPKNQCSWGDFCTHAHGEVRSPTMPTGGPGTNIPAQPKDKPKLGKTSPSLNSKSQAATKRTSKTSKPQARVVKLSGQSGARASPWTRGPALAASNSAPAQTNTRAVPPPPPRDKPAWGQAPSSASVASSAMNARSLPFARSPSSVTSSAGPAPRMGAQPPRSLPNSPGFHKPYSSNISDTHSQFDDCRGESLDLSSVFPDEHSPFKDLYHHAAAGPEGTLEGLSSIQEHENHDIGGASFAPITNQKAKSSLSVFTDDSQAGSVTSDAQTQFSLAFDKPLRIGQTDRLSLEREVVSLREKMVDLERNLRLMTAERDSLKNQLQLRDGMNHDLLSPLGHQFSESDKLMKDRRRSSLDAYTPSLGLSDFFRDLPQ